MNMLRTSLVTLVTAALLAAGTQAAEAKADFTVTASVSTSTTIVGGSFLLSGTVSPSAKGSTVRIQRKYVGGSWTTIDTDQLSSKSEYAVRIRPSRGGPTSYRVSKAGSDGRGGDISPTKVVNVYRWRYLVDLKPRLADGDVSIGSWSMKGSTFEKSISIYGNPPQWDIATPRCTKFRSFVGVDDDSPDTTTADTQVILDFATDHEYTMAQVEDLAWGTYPTYIQEPIPPGHTDIIFVGDANPNGGLQQDYLTYGTPQVYCNS